MKTDSWRQGGKTRYYRVEIGADKPLSVGVVWEYDFEPAFKFVSFDDYNPISGQRKTRVIGQPNKPMKAIHKDFVKYLRRQEMLENRYFLRVIFQCMVYDNDERHRPPVVIRPILCFEVEIASEVYNGIESKTLALGIGWLEGTVENVPSIQFSRRQFEIKDGLICCFLEYSADLNLHNLEAFEFAMVASGWARSEPLLSDVAGVYRQDGT